MCIAEWCHFSDIHISQGSVATWLRRGGIFKHEFVANLLPSPLVKKFWKSGNSWWNYGQEFGVLFFLTHGVHQMLHESKSVCVSVSLCSVFSRSRPNLTCGLTIPPTWSRRSFCRGTALYSDGFSIASYAWSTTPRSFREDRKHRFAMHLSIDRISFAPAAAETSRQRQRGQSSWWTLVPQQTPEPTSNTLHLRRLGVQQIFLFNVSWWWC